MNFKSLVSKIEHTHTVLHKQAIKAININLTLRNYFIGLYIVEYEQLGDDRAQYGKKLLFKLSESINSKGFSETNLKLYRQFYLAYPELISVIQNSDSPDINQIRQTASDEFKTRKHWTNKIIYRTL